MDFNAVFPFLRELHRPLSGYKLAPLDSRLKRAWLNCQVPPHSIGDDTPASVVPQGGAAGVAV
jgi:hypothetical protein